MTENKKITNGVDVSECCWCDIEPDDEPYCLINDGENLSCEDNPNCYFKQLKRKKQKLEKIKEISKEYKVEYTVNNGVQLLTNKILQIIEGEENE